MSDFTPGRLAADARHQPADADAGDVRSGLQGGRQRSAGRQALVLLDVPDYQAVLQNEEHLVVETPAADRFQPGDEVLAIPTHICPTCAMHKQAYVIEKGEVIGKWDIAARDRMLSV